MLIAGHNRMSSISSCLGAAAQFLLPRAAAIDIVESQLTSIINHWDAICDEASLRTADRAFLWGRQFLNPYAFEDLIGDAAHLKVLADKARF